MGRTTNHKQHTYSCICQWPECSSWQRVFLEGNDVRAGCIRIKFGPLATGPAFRAMLAHYLHNKRGGTDAEKQLKDNLDTMATGFIAKHHYTPEQIAHLDKTKPGKTYRASTKVGLDMAQLCYQGRPETRDMVIVGGVEAKYYITPSVPVEAVEAEVSRIQSELRSREDDDSGSRSSRKRRRETAKEKATEAAKNLLLFKQKN